MSLEQPLFEQMLSNSHCLFLQKSFVLTLFEQRVKKIIAKSYRFPKNFNEEKNLGLKLLETGLVKGIQNLQKKVLV
jgi:uncharacterized Rmd1/YagE family protein